MMNMYNILKKESLCTLIKCTSISLTEKIRQPLKWIYRASFVGNFCLRLLVIIHATAVLVGPTHSYHFRQGIHCLPTHLAVFTQRELQAMMDNGIKHSLLHPLINVQNSYARKCIIMDIFNVVNVVMYHRTSGMNPPRC